MLIAFTRFQPASPPSFPVYRQVFRRYLGGLSQGFSTCLKKFRKAWGKPEKVRETQENDGAELVEKLIALFLTRKLESIWNRLYGMAW